VTIMGFTYSYSKKSKEGRREKKRRPNRAKPTMIGEKKKKSAQNILALGHPVHGFDGKRRKKKGSAVNF